MGYMLSSAPPSSSEKSHITLYYINLCTHTHRHTHLFMYVYVFMYCLFLHFQEQDHSHSISWRTTQKGKSESRKQNCHTKGPIKTVLKRNKFFSTFEKKNKGKELVIKIQGRAISYHFPCFLIDESSMPLDVECIASNDTRQKAKHTVTRHKREETEYVVFHVNIQEGQRIVRNPALKRVVQTLTVYAYRGETVREALQRDGRFHSNVFNGHELLHLDTKDIVMLSAHVDDIENVTLEIQSSSEPGIPPQSPEDFNSALLESQSSSQPDSIPDCVEDDA